MKLFDFRQDFAEPAGPLSLPEGGIALMKKLASLLLAAGMLLSVFAPAAAALPADTASAVEPAAIVTEEPGTAPEEPGTAPEEPGTVPEEPGTVTEEPGTAPEEPGTAPEEPDTVPEEPGTVPEEPGTVPEEPGTAPEEPDTVTEAPAATEPAAEVAPQNMLLEVPALEEPSAAPAAPVQRSASALVTSYRVTTADGVSFESEDPFGAMTMVVDKEYTLTPLVGEQTPTQAGYTLTNVSLPSGSGTLTVQQAGNDSITVTATEISTVPVYFGTLQFTLQTQSTPPTSETVSLACFSTVVADTGNALFVNTATGAPLSSLEFSTTQNTCTLQFPGLPEGSAVQYETNVSSDSIQVTPQEDPSRVEVTVKQALTFGCYLYATATTPTNEVRHAYLTLSWYEDVSGESQTLPPESNPYSTICFGSYSDSEYYPKGSERWTLGYSDTITGTLSVFFRKALAAAPHYAYNCLPTEPDQPSTVKNITVESLTPETLTITGTTPQQGEDPFTFQYALDGTRCTTAKVKATVTLTDDASYTAVFLLDVVESTTDPAPTVVTDSDSLRQALQDPRPGTVIELAPGTYEGDFTVSHGTTLRPQNYNGTQHPYDPATGKITPNDPEVTIQGTLTAQSAGVEVQGIHFVAPPNAGSSATALYDVESVTGCSFQDYGVAVAFSGNISNSSHVVQYSAFEDNTVAIRFAEREWFSQLQNNSFLHNDVAIQLESNCYVDGLFSHAYGTTINRGKWTRNLFRGDAGQKVLNDQHTTPDVSLLLNYNYYAYGDTAFTAAQFIGDYLCDVFYTTPEMTCVTTNKDLSQLKGTGLNLVAQEADASRPDSALNLDSKLFTELKNSDAESELQLNVWNTEDELAAVWDFDKSSLRTDWQADASVNLGVNDVLNTREQDIVTQAMDAGDQYQKVSFDHSGNLPGTATVELPLAEDLDTEGQEFSLYYIDEANQTLEKMDTTVTVDENTKTLSFAISHCSSYIVTAAEPQIASPRPTVTPGQTSEPQSGSTPAAQAQSQAVSAPTATPVPGAGTAYYTCPACGYHNWTATADGYRCDHCGYLESVKQLSAYGNVKGLYTPASAAAAPKAAAASSAIPQTGDALPLTVLVVVAIAALAGLGILLYLKKRNGR